jgi:beta-lactam-binding protein with PASTA domain
MHVEATPLTPLIVYKPARAGQRTGIVVEQSPSEGTLSAHDRLTLVVTRSLHGVVPRVIGLPVARAKARLAHLHVDVHVAGGGPKVGAQSPAPGSAAAPGLRVTLSATGG